MHRIAPRLRRASDRGAERAAGLYGLIEIAKLNGLDPEAYFRNVLTRIAEHPASKLNDLLPWRWTPFAAAAAKAAGQAQVYSPRG